MRPTLGTVVNDRLSRACHMSIANALGALLPTVGALGNYIGTKGLSCEGLRL